MTDISKILLPGEAQPHSVQDSVARAAIADKEDKSNKITSISASSTDTQYPSAKAVYTIIKNLPSPMVFKGTLGTGGTITSLPAASAANEGYTYKVITAGTYASTAAKAGDVFISNGSAWVLVPAGDDIDDTWRNIKVNGTELLGTNISSGAVNFKNGSYITISGSGNSITVDAKVDTTPTDSSAKLITSGGIKAYVDSKALPAVSASDNGKFLTVVNGAWSASVVPNAENVAF